VLTHSRTDDSSPNSGGLSRVLKVVLVAYIVIASVLAIDVLVTDGIGKSVVGPIGALTIGVMLWFRDRKPGAHG
jgi:hypothetical protein